MADITHGTWIKDGKAVDAVYQSGVKVYGRNLITEGHDQIISSESSDYNYRVLYTKLVPGIKYNFQTIATLTGSADNLVTVSVYGSDFGVPALVKTEIVANGEVSSCQFTAPDNGEFVLIYAGKQGATSGIEANFKQIKLEIGDQTAFSIAPEDILN
ncbi:hypothetical protein [Lactiplantibacillus plantarum]|uniref:hypothetical protein n=1 Tax=Lactiplantibacillus plantarum TaxID=1590 RepID=UPI000977A2EF|nr:hypothetical protein [Lactiplantibacillus plantarum]AVH85831.1 alanyl-tRNA synthetase [Lactobacillus phage PM411]PKX64415.1 hypothetical protein CUB88_14995 [Lactiplantibacillus plantarum]